MKLRALVGIGTSSIRHDPGTAVSAILGVSLGAFALVFFAAFGRGVSEVLREKLFPVQAQYLEVVPPKMAFSALATGMVLDEAAAGRLAALQGVQAVYRKMNVRAPAMTRYQGDFFGHPVHLAFDFAMVGVEPGLVAADVRRGNFGAGDATAAIPALVSTRFLEVYNKSFAPVRGLPVLSPELMNGFVFPVRLNSSVVGVQPTGPILEKSLEVVGASDFGSLAGVVVPLSVAAALNRSLGLDADTYSALLLRAKHPDDIPRLIRDVRSMGYGVDEQERQLATHLGTAVSLATWAMVLLAALITALAGVNVANGLAQLVERRKREYAVFQALGATPRDLVSLVLFEAGSYGLTGGLLGAFAALASARLLDVLLLRYGPTFPFRPDSFFIFEPMNLFSGVVVGTLAALAGAVGPSIRVAKLNPAEALSEAL